MRNVMKARHILTFLLILALVWTLAPVGMAEESAAEHKWWQDTIVYQVYPQSFRTQTETATATSGAWTPTWITSLPWGSALSG